MAARLKLKCLQCNKEDSFLDAKDVTQNKWQILAWAIELNEPVVVCPKCDYNPAVQKPTHSKGK